MTIPERRVQKSVFMAGAEEALYGDREEGKEGEGNTCLFVYM